MFCFVHCGDRVLDSSSSTLSPVVTLEQQEITVRGGGALYRENNLETIVIFSIVKLRLTLSKFL